MTSSAAATHLPLLLLAPPLLRMRETSLATLGFSATLRTFMGMPYGPKRPRTSQLQQPCLNFCSSCSRCWRAGVAMLTINEYQQRSSQATVKSN
jgi:hypothetical protein